MKNRTVKFLLVSIVCLFALCVIIYFLMTYGMNKRGADAIGELGELYMSDMSEQAATHFGTTIELRLSQVSALIDAVPPTSGHDSDSIRVALNNNARLRGFDHLALCGEDGGFEMLYGSNLRVDDPETFLSALKDGEENMSAGSDERGNRLVIMGIPAAYDMKGGGKSVALVAALPITYISDTLSLDAEKETIYYFIINRDGEFIIRDEDVTDESYFQRVRDKYESVNGLTGEEYLAELKKAMESGANYTNQFIINGERGSERRFLYCTALPFSDWYFLLFLPYGQFDETINTLGYSWSVASVLSCAAILVALGIIFAFYFRSARKQMRELEEAKRLAEYASKAKSEFLSNMSHDIRTPMNGIVGMTAIAAANAGDEEQVKNCLKKIDLSSRHLLGLINDILDMSKIESGKLELHNERMSLGEAVKSVTNIAQPQAVAKNQNFEVNLHDIICDEMICDGVRFNQILINLLGNAVKFTPEGGDILLDCRQEPSPSGDNFVRTVITVRDTGIGMTEEFLTKIFDAFAREDTGRVQKTEGTGLGMAITKYIVDAMHGSIEVKSKLNEGSEFTVVLDFERALQENAEQTPPDDGVYDFTGRRLLLAEDNDLNREIAVELLSGVGFETDTAENGKICAEKFAASEEGWYDAVLMDIRMPVMSGYDATRAIRAMDRSDAADVPIIAMSADAFSDDVKKCIDCGMNAHIAKPIDMDVVSRVLFRYIRAK